MRTINWEENDSSLEIVRAINAKEEFVVTAKGALAQAFISVLGASHMSISPENGKLLIAITTILALVALAFFAIARGYKVSGRARTPDGTEYEVLFEHRA